MMVKNDVRRERERETVECRNHLCVEINIKIKNGKVLISVVLV